MHQEPRGARRIGFCLGKEVPFNDMKLIHVILCRYLHIIITVDTTIRRLIILNIVSRFKNNLMKGHLGGSVRHLTLGLASSHDLTFDELELQVGLLADRAIPAWDSSFLFAPPQLVHTHALTLLK